MTFSGISMKYLVWQPHLFLLHDFTLSSCSTTALCKKTKKKKSDPTVFLLYEFPQASWLFVTIVWAFFTAETLGLARKWTGVIVNDASQKAHWSIMVLSTVSLTYETYWSSCMSCWCTCAWNSLCYNSHLFNARVLNPSGYVSLSPFTFNQCNLYESTQKVN